MLENLLVFGGKGGVGKSSISTATAVYLAEQFPNKNVLLISFDIAHNLTDLFKREIGNKITQITPNLYAIEPDPDAYAEKYTKAFAEKTRELLKSTFIVGQIPELEEFINSTFQGKNIPLALKNSIFFQSILDAEHPIEHMDETITYEEMSSDGTSSKKEGYPEFHIIVADFPPTGNMIALFEIPENHVQQLLKYSLEMVSTVQDFLNKLKKVGKVLNPLGWMTRSNKRDKQKNLAQDILDILHETEERGKRISQLMKGIGSLRLVTIAEKPSYEEIKRAKELSQPYITLDAIHINRLIPEEFEGSNEFLDNLIKNQKKYVKLIEESFGEFKIWKSHYLDEEPIGIEGLLRLAKEVYGDTPPEEILNPNNRILINPEFKKTVNPVRIVDNEESSDKDNAEEKNEEYDFF